MATRYAISVTDVTEEETKKSKGGRDFKFPISSGEEVNRASHDGDVKFPAEEESNSLLLSPNDYSVVVDTKGCEITLCFSTIFVRGFATQAATA